MVVVEPVKAAILQCINLYNYRDAAFLCERLYAEVANTESLGLLSSCYYRMNKPWKAYMLLTSRKPLSVECRYLLARCCLDLNKLSEAETAITENYSLHNTRGIDDITEEFGDLASYALNILGQVYNKSERKKKAIECFQASLKLNPFLWSSFEMLCELGDTSDPNLIFQVNSQNLHAVCNSTNNYSNNSFHIDHITPIHPASTCKISNMTIEDFPLTTRKELFSNIVDTPEIGPTNITPDTDFIFSVPSAPRPKRHRDQFKMDSSGSMGWYPTTPSFGVMPLEFTPSANMDSPPANASLMSPTTVSLKTAQPFSMPGIPKPPVFSQSGNMNISKDSQQSVTNMGCPSNTPSLRRSTRLFNHTNSSVKENNKNQAIENRSIVGRGAGRRTKSKLSYTPQQMNERNKIQSGITQSSTAVKKILATPADSNAQPHVAEMQKQSASGLMLLLQQLAKAYQALSQYKCKEAIELFEKIPVHHHHSGWVLCQIGKAYFELCEYKKAKAMFEDIRNLEPWRMEGMEVYSTVLWHMQQETALSALAQDLVDIDKLSPEAWCATGNCFSLQKEHDVAIKFFQRAMQVNPEFAYAYTLLGHEYVLIEELDKALAAFQSAVRINPRHYNAWYGIGMVHYKQEKFSLAGIYYEKALAINPKNSALLCHVAVVKHALKKTASALKILNYAINVEPMNPLCKFHKASVLFASDRHSEALKELNELKQIVPRESLVYFLIGKIHKKLGGTHIALTNFSWAMDLDPKGTNNHIKETINKRYIVDEEGITPEKETMEINEMEEMALSNMMQLIGGPPRIEDSDDA